VNWLSDNYKWLFDGVGGALGVALLLYLVQRFGKRQPAGQETAATLTAQGSKVTSSTVASGSRINQTVNSPTVNLNLGKPASEGIHKHQVDALLAITPKLEHALFYLQRAASGSKFQGEASDQELLRRMGVDLAAASTEYSQKKLLIDVSLTRKIDEFFSKVVSAGMSLNHALDPMTPNGETRANHWRRAQEIADKELPPLLRAIQTDSRAVIHR